MYIYNYIFIFLLGFISYTDMRYRVISNIQVISCFIMIAIGSYIFALELNIIAAIITLIIGFIVWKIKLVGAGDIKLLSVLMLFVKPSYVGEFLFLMSVFGAFLAIVILLAKKRHLGVPYGVAIACSFVLLLIYN